MGGLGTVLILAGIVTEVLFVAGSGLWKVAGLSDDDHVAVQRERYARRREVLLPALQRAGFTIDHSEAGLYLWATRGEANGLHPDVTWCNIHPWPVQP